MSYVEQQEQACMTLEVRMSTERETWKSEGLTLKEQMTLPQQTSQPVTAPPPQNVGRLQVILGGRELERLLQHPPPHAE
eukprot:498688-Amphidinium_carterae.1